MSEEPLPPAEALTAARALLAHGRPFSAHEVLEASWKAAPPQERGLWQGLAQLCVGVTHLERGNPVGAARLLRRGAGNLPPQAPYGLDVDALVRWAQALAEQIEAGRREPSPVPL